MYNEKLENISKTDKELLEKHNKNSFDLIQQKQTDFMKFLCNELDNLKMLINDPLYLSEYFWISIGNTEIHYDIYKDSFYIRKNNVYISKNMAYANFYVENFKEFKLHILNENLEKDFKRVNESIFRFKEKYLEFLERI